MLPALAAVALALHAFAAVADEVPTLNVGALCRAEAKAAPEFSKACMADRTGRGKISSASGRNSRRTAGQGAQRCRPASPAVESYVELLTCLQMARDVKNLPKQ